MKQKTYELNGLTYGYSLKFRKWIFRTGNFEFLTECREGAETAHKIANIINGAIKRSGSLDNLARANISKLNRE